MMYDLYNNEVIHKEVLTCDNFFDSIATAGDYVAHSVVKEAIKRLPPVSMTDECTQSGKTFSLRRNPDTGKLQRTYPTFKLIIDTENKIWQYCGHCFPGETIERGQDVSIMGNVMCV